MVYITMSEGFRHGGANAFPLTGPFAGDAALVKINPDEVTNTEIGLKGQSADGSLTYSMAVFKMEWEDVQLDTFLGPLSIPSAINGEEAETEGFEIEVTKQVTDNFRISAGYSYVDAALTENADLDGDGTDDAFSGEEMAGVSENTASIMLDYIQPLASGKNIVYHLDGSYRSDFKTTFNEAAGNYAELDGFSIFNASVSLESETVNYTLFVRNLGDEEGVTGAVNNRHALAPFASRAYTMYPRTVGFKMSYNF
jgi:outer membrane receptor protein involved in Fe transport